MSYQEIAFVLSNTHVGDVLRVTALSSYQMVGEYSVEAAIETVSTFKNGSVTVSFVGLQDRCIFCTTGSGHALSEFGTLHAKPKDQVTQVEIVRIAS